ncbi:serine/threonine protein kinase [Pyxidicoccus trucidator]|uniref:serine/threonine protein kinase n=1 Tax=Pyxidicoccus trucidator TaxID=2709662 RepID=UPI0013DBAB7F|nr:serine/threonine-protein kinase [Pyxidicoccus trucidator]
MSNFRKCARCGSAHPAGTTVCPPNTSELVAPGSYSPYGAAEDDATVRRKPDATPASARPLVSGAPAAFVAEEGEWEKSVSRDVMVGKQLGDYVVKRRIGAGGMGIVYEGEHPVIGRKVAIKVLRPDFAEGARARDLASEARAAASIRHRGIIDIFGFGTIPGVGQYLVMEFLDGLPLDEVINQRAPMLEVEVVTVLDDLLGALGAAHAAGVIHRDLKPGNVFVVRDGSGNEYVKVLDFGLAKRSEAPNGSTPQTRASMMVGTPEYMAPEQACGQQVGPPTDLYAVGVIAFEMLTRRLPFEGASPMAIAVHHVRTPPPSPSTYVELHPALEALVMQLLAKTPEERPASAEAVRRELKGILKQLSRDATQLSAPPRVGAASTLSQESVAVPPQRVRTERYGQPGRRTGPPGATRRATPYPSAPLSSGLTHAEAALAMGPTSKDLPAVPSGRGRAVMFGVGGALLLALLVAGASWMSRGGEPVPPTPRTLTAGAVGVTMPLRERPTASESAPEPRAVAMPTHETPPDRMGGMEPGSTGANDVQLAGGQTPTLAATVLAKDSRALRVDEPVRTRRTTRVVGIAGGGRTPAGRTDAAREAQAREPATTAMGTLTLKVKGYVKEVLVDGKSHGRKYQLELPAGLHKLEVRGNAFTLPYSSHVTILAGDQTEQHVVLEPIQ